MRRKTWGWFVLAGACAIGAALALPLTSATVVYELTGVTASAAILCGLALHRPKVRLPWLCSAAGQLLFIAGDVLWVYYDLAGIDPFPSLADILYLAAYPALALGMVRLIRARTPGKDRASLLDAAIITTGVGVLAWVFLLHPQAAASEATFAEQAVSLAYPLSDVALVALLVRLAVGSGRRSVAFCMLLASVLVMTVADVGYLLETLAGATEPLRVLQAGWLTAYVLWGAAALHPSMASLEEATKVRDGTLSRGRLAVLMLASITGPVVLLLRYEAGQPLDVPVVALASVVLFGLVVARMAGLVRVVGELMQRKGEERFRSLVEHASEVITITNTDGAVCYVSPAVRRVWGYTAAEYAQASLDDLVHPGDRARVREHLLRAATGAPGATRAIQGRIRHRDGSWRQFEATAANLLHDPNVAGVVVTARDVTLRAELEAQLTEQAFHDPLTGLANRALFLDRVEHGLARHARDHRPLAVLFVDLDDFKTVNDSLGHAAGDELLVAAAARVAGCLRPSDTAARLGGDEFAVLLDNTGGAEAVAAVAERIIAALRAPVSLQGVDVAIHSSIGVALAHEGSVPGELLRNADMAMYAAKTRGKGRYELFEPPMHHRALERLGLRADLAKALDRDELAVVYQPIVDLHTGQTVGTEALLRWEHPVRGTVAPLDFVPFAEETGLIVPIGRWVLEQACLQTRRWQLRRPQEPELYISVNVSGAQMREDQIVDDVVHALGVSGLSPEYLVIELTESVLLHDSDAAVDALHRLKQLGVRIAVDDFGTGYCSMTYLQRFPVDLLKIDRAFVRDLGHGAEQSTLTRGIMGLAQALDLEAIAEGIEDEGQLADLQALGCRFGQGFYFARPLAAAAVVDFLESQLVGT